MPLRRGQRNGARLGQQVGQPGLVRQPALGPRQNRAGEAGPVSGSGSGQMFQQQMQPCAAQHCRRRDGRAEGVLQKSSLRSMVMGLSMMMMLLAWMVTTISIKMRLRSAGSANNH